MPAAARIFVRLCTNCKLACSGRHRSSNLAADAGIRVLNRQLQAERRLRLRTKTKCSKERKAPLHVRVCERCFLVQLEEFEPPEHIFSVAATNRPT